jgi:hypothetical protein
METPILPIASEAERLTLNRAFADLAASEFHGARAHLRDAGAALTAGDYERSRKHPRCRVGGAKPLAFWQTQHRSGEFRKIRGDPRGTLAICGYTSDEQGIRHPLIDGPLANVDETDALFMIGACASFVSYLIGKARSAGLLKKKK